MGRRRGGGGWLEAPVDAGGAEIGDRDTVRVTVKGSTALPAQLLVALLLMAGGARLSSGSARVSGPVATYEVQ